MEGETVRTSNSCYIFPPVESVYFFSVSSGQGQANIELEDTLSL